MKPCILLASTIFCVTLMALIASVGAQEPAAEVKFTLYPADSAKTNAQLKQDIADALGHLAVHVDNITISAAHTDSEIA